MGLGGGNNMEDNGLRGGSGGAPGRKLRVSCSSLGSRSAASTAPEGRWPLSNQQGCQRLVWFAKHERNSTSFT